MSTCTVLANAAHWLMLIILCSNYLTIIAISLMIILFFFFFSSFCCCSVFFNDAGCRAWTTSFPSECFQRTYQRLCYYLSPSFPWLTRAYSGLLNRRKRRGGCCLALSLHMARHWNGEAGQTSRRTEDRLPAPPSAWSGHAEYSSTDHDGQKQHPWHGPAGVRLPQ